MAKKAARKDDTSGQQTPSQGTPPPVVRVTGMEHNGPTPVTIQDSIPIPVQLQSSLSEQTVDQPLWVWIRNRTQAISFAEYQDFIDKVLCQTESDYTHQLNKTKEKHKIKKNLDDVIGSGVYGVGAYSLLRTATEAFLLLQCGVAVDEGGLFDPLEEAARLKNWPAGAVTSEGMKARLRTYLGDTKLPYIQRIIEASFPDETETKSPFCHGLLASKVSGPCLIELIWSYWHEQGMLVQTFKAISLRFQNIRGRLRQDPLAHLEIDPLRPLNNLLWGYIQEEQHRLTVPRRVYEYDHHYGMTLDGKAVPNLRPADSRSKFLEGFHSLLHLCAIYYREKSDTTVVPDGFPLLNSLKEVHLLLAQGAHNQFGDLPWTARVEMLIEQWLAARPEVRDFLASRAMVPYKEPWMPQVDTMKRLQGWNDVTVSHFRDLGVFGEQILLSIRYGDWIGVTSEDQAKNWADYWRQEIQGYIHAYRTVAGVDLTADMVDFTQPAVHLRNRLKGQHSSRA